MRRLDAMIIGGGPAGLSAALVLGRCRRSVVLFDSGRYRNAASHAVHGFLTRDGISPVELRRLAREQLQQYPTIELREVQVVAVDHDPDGFRAQCSDGATVLARKLLLATGVTDELPPVAGAAELFGDGLFQCPYCDGWEHRDQRLVVYARSAEKGVAMALEMTLWSRAVILCTDGVGPLDAASAQRLVQHGIEVREQRIERVARTPVGVTVTFADGSELECGAMFFNTACHQQSDFAAKLGCDLDERGAPQLTRFAATNVPGLYVAGDASRDVLQAIVGAAEGCEAAVAINQALLHEDLGI